MARKRDAFSHHLEDLSALLGGELVHGHDNAHIMPDRSSIIL